MRTKSNIINLTLYEDQEQHNKPNIICMRTKSNIINLTVYEDHDHLSSIYHHLFMIPQYKGVKHVKPDKMRNENSEIS